MVRTLAVSLSKAKRVHTCPAALPPEINYALLISEAGWMGHRMMIRWGLEVKYHVLQKLAHRPRKRVKSY
jgi:hypothetical protein